MGVVFLFRKRRVLAALLFLLPLAMHLAAALQKCPYGGHFKFSMYIAPMIYLVMGVGSLLRDTLNPYKTTSDQRQRALARWLVHMKQQYQFVGREVYPLPRHDKRNRRIVTVDYLEIYTFQQPEGQNPEL